MMGAIYALAFKNCTSGRRYIGSAVSLTARMRSHMYLLRQGRHHSIGLQRAANKYGLDNLRVDVLEIVDDRSRLIEREQCWLNEFAGALYNRSPTAASRLGAKMSTEARAKISTSLIGNSRRRGIQHNADDREKISDGVKRSYASGKHKRSTGNVLLFQPFLEGVRSGTRVHPRVLSDSRVIDILTTLYETRSLDRTAELYGICRGTVWYTAKQFRSRLDDAVEAATGMPAPRRRRSAVIHPDWFSMAL